MRSEHLKLVPQTAVDAVIVHLREANAPAATRRFDVVANLAIGDSEEQLAAGSGKSVYHSYIAAIKRR